MDSRSVFHLDCNPVIPQCGFQCPKCIQEIESTLTAIEGVSKAYIGVAGEEQRLIVEYRPNTATVERLLDALKELPSFYHGKFIPTVIENVGKGG